MDSLDFITKTWLKKAYSKEFIAKLRKLLRPLYVYVVMIDHGGHDEVSGVFTNEVSADKRIAKLIREGYDEANLQGYKFKLLGRERN